MRAWILDVDDGKELLQELAEIRSVIEGGFIALIAHQIHAADRARGIDRCIASATQIVREAASSARQADQPQADRPQFRKSYTQSLRLLRRA